MAACQSAARALRAAKKVSMTPSRMSARDLFAALAIVVIWGTNFVAMKTALRDFTPFQLGAARYVLAAFPLLLVVRPPKMAWKWIVLYGLFQGVGQFGFLFVALRVGMTASLASVLLQTQVFFTALFGLLLLREKIGRPLRWGLGIAALGLGCFGMNYLQPSAAGASATTVLGFVLSLTAASMWAASNTVVRLAQRESPRFDALNFMVWISVVPIAPFLLLTWYFDDAATRWNWLHASWSSWVAAAYLGWMATILAYAMWTGLLQRHPVNRVAPFSLGVPVVGLLAGTLALGEVVTGWQWVGVALIVASLACVLLGGRLGRAARVPESAQSSASGTPP
jgi:O-acetylserine/cysteine efflux transporter